MDNSPELSRYSKLSQSQHSYHVSPEPIILRQEQEDSSSDKDEQSDSFVERDTHDNHAVATELVVALEALPAKAILPSFYWSLADTLIALAF